MIKLKSLIIKEKINEPFDIGVPPPEVIRVYEKIKKHIKLKLPNANPDHWVEVTGPTPDSDYHDMVWSLNIPETFYVEKGFYLGYYIKRKKWRWFYTEHDSIEKEGDVKDENHLDEIIKLWTKRS